MAQKQYDVISTKTAEQIREAMLDDDLILVLVETRKFLPGDSIVIRSWDKEIFIGTVVLNEYTDDNGDHLLVEV